MEIPRRASKGSAVRTRDYRPIGKWKMNKVTDTSFMFDSGESFDQSLKKWDVSKVTTMERMFQHAKFLTA